MLLRRSARRSPGVFVLVFCLCAKVALADEGMWLYNAPPLARLKEKYHFEPTPEWLQHLQKASVRFSSGGSGSFVSETGLVITNHHVGLDTLQKISSEKNNYVRDGFYAKTPAEEPKATDLELNVLVSIEDVSARVNGAVKPEMNADQSASARRTEVAAIEKESKEKTGLRADVITLFQGGAYHLYRYKRYDDVRLVFAPEQQVAFYGGDPDNFEYPRFDLDICIFRAYENGQPAKPAEFLKWSANGAAEHALVLVSGHPAATNRQLTIAETTDLRDRHVPDLLRKYFRREALLSSYAARSSENARKAREDLFGVQNNRKRYGGYVATLLDPEIMAAFVQRENSLGAKMKADPKLAATMNAYGKIEGAQAEIARIGARYDYLEAERKIRDAFTRAQGFYSTLFGYARALVRSGDERGKANGERLPEFRDSARETFELQLFSAQPIYDDFEQLTLTDSLTDLAQHLGANDPLVMTILAGKSPGARAAELIKGTKLKDVAMRRKLYEGGAAVVDAAHDPMLDLARAIDNAARGLRKNVESLEEVKQQAYAQIAAARFALEGATNYPDATFTLRLSYGPVEGYEENGQRVPAFTTFGGLFQRSAEHENKAPFDVPARWLERKDRLALETPFNFVCTADIIGGSSGSPVVNTAGEFVGIIFDGNIQSLALDTVYTEKQARAVSTDSRAILQALRKIYDANALADELEGARK